MDFSTSSTEEEIRLLAYGRHLNNRNTDLSLNSIDIDQKKKFGNHKSKNFKDFYHKSPNTQINNSSYIYSSPTSKTNIKKKNYDNQFSSNILYGTPSNKNQPEKNLYGSKTLPTGKNLKKQNHKKSSTPRTNLISKNKLIYPSDSDSNEWINNYQVNVPTNKKNDTIFQDNSKNKDTKMIEESISDSNDKFSCIIAYGSSEYDDGSAQFIIDRMKRNFAKLSKLLEEDDDPI